MAKAPRRNARTATSATRVRSRRPRVAVRPCTVQGLRGRFFLAGGVSGPPTWIAPDGAGAGAGAGGVEVTDSEGLCALLIAVSKRWRCEVGLSFTVEPASAWVNLKPLGTWSV